MSRHPTGPPAWPEGPERRGEGLLHAVRAVLPWALWPAAVAATVLGVAPLLDAFTGTGLVPLAVASAVVPVLLAALPVLAGAGAARAGRIGAVSRRLARAGWWTVAASAVAWAAFLVLAVVGPSHAGDAWRGLVDGSARLLSVTLPVHQPRWLLVVPVTVCWIAGLGAGELLVRHRAVAAAGVWLCAFTVSLVLTAGDPDRAVGPAVALVVVAGAVVVAGRWLATAALPGSGPLSVPRTGSPTVAPTVPATSEPPGWAAEAPPLRPVAQGALVLAVAGVVLAVAVPAAGFLQGRPVSPARRPPVLQKAPVDPTDVAAQLRRADTHRGLLTVRTSRPFDGYLPMVVLDDYDGDTWKLDTTFEPTGGRVPAPAGTPSGGAVVVARATVDHPLPGPWMAVVGQPGTVGGTAVDYDPRTAMIVPAAGLAAGTHYVVQGRTPLRSLAGFDGAHLPALAGSPDPADLAVPASLQPYLDAVVRTVAADADVAPAPTLAFVAAMAAELRSADTELAVPAAAGATTTDELDEGGTSFAAVVHAVVTARQATPEQFATLLALMARAEGVPARVVVGFRLPGAATGRAVGGHGPVTLTGADVWTWVEVPVAGTGWVAVDPTPTTAGAPPAPAGSSSSVTRAPSSPTQAVAVPGSGGHALAAPVRHVAPAGAAWWPWWVVAAAVVVLAALGTPALTWLRRRRRRSRRRRGEPSAQVVGAWHEVLDTLAESRCRGLRPLTTTEVAEAAADRLGPEVAAPVARVGALADRALFSSLAVSSTEAASAWAEGEQVRLACRRAMGPADRLRSHLTVAGRR